MYIAHGHETRAHTTIHIAPTCHFPVSLCESFCLSLSLREKLCELLPLSVFLARTLSNSCLSRSRFRSRPRPHHPSRWSDIHCSCRTCSPDIAPGKIQGRTAPLRYYDGRRVRPEQRHCILFQGYRSWKPLLQREFVQDCQYALCRHS